MTKQSSEPSRILGGLETSARPHRDLLLATVDTIALSSGWGLAQLFRGSNNAELWVLPTMAVVLLVVGFFLGLYRNRWSVASFSEIIAIAWSYGLAVFVAIAVASIMGRPEAALIALSSSLFGLLVAGGLRSLWRVGWERQLSPGDGAAPIIIMGGGRAGEQIARAMLLDHESPFRPVAFLDDDRSRSNRKVMGVPVLGTTEDLGEVAERTGARKVLIAMPSASNAGLQRLLDLAKEQNVEAFGLPNVREMFGADVQLSDIRPVKAADLLNRREIKADLGAIGDYLKGKRVLVTGAGGSIGSELCRQIQQFDVASLLILDRDESGIHATQLSIEGSALLSDPKLIVADIRDSARLHEVFAIHRPDIVFHAAALKHQPLLELHPSEAWKTNILGTLNVLEAARSVGVSCFVNVSTDKAAQPCSVLGYSKRTAERLTAAFAETHSGRYLSVRFGNVLGSRGSMLETFRAQISRGDALTVTHPDITRYFMTVEEAVLLLIQAGAIGQSGEVLILDMGEPVRIADVALRLASTVNPPAEIRFVGLRPNEKMHEQLFGPGEVDVRPFHSLISHVPVQPLSLKHLHRITATPTQSDHRKAMIELVNSDIEPTSQADAR